MRPDTLVRQLDQAARDLPDEAITLGRLCEACGGAARGSALVMLSFACVLPLPGVGTVLGVAMLALCAGLWRGDVQLVLPQRAQAWAVPRRAAQRLLGWQSQLYRWAGRWSRPRWRRLARLPARSPLTLVAASMAGLIVLPIPFGNVLPAASLAVLGLGLVCRDGLVVAMSLLLAALAWALAGGLLWATWAASHPGVGSRPPRPLRVCALPHRHARTGACTVRDDPICPDCVRWPPPRSIPRERSMITMRLDLELDYQVNSAGSDFIFNIHAAHTERQRVVSESLHLSQNVPYRIDTDPVTHNRYLRLTAFPGPLRVSYNATIEINHYVARPESIAEVPVAQLPTAALSYIYPSRYCQSDRLHRLAMREFGQQWQGYARVQGIRDWVLQRTAFTPNTSNSATSAVDTLLETVGVCRDFAHLMIALCRAVNIPARFATGIDYGADPVLGPPDFHAYVEVYLAGRWYIFDPSGTAIPMSFVRFGTGRDAADVAFATIFGSVTSGAPRIIFEPVAGADGQLWVPQHTTDALSTDQ